MLQLPALLLLQSDGGALSAPSPLWAWHGQMAAYLSGLAAHGRGAVSTGGANVPDLHTEVCEAHIEHHVVKALLRLPIIASGLAFAMANYMFYFFLSWFPSYLMAERQFTLQQMGLVNSIPWSVGLIGVVTSGLISAWVTRRVGDPVLASKIVLITVLSAAGACAIFVPFAPNGLVAAIVMAGGMGFLFLGGGNYFTVVLQSVGVEIFGAATSAVVICGSLSGIAASAISGSLIKSSGGYTSAFVTTGGLVLVGALLVLLFVSGSTPGTTKIAHRGSGERVGPH